MNLAVLRRVAVKKNLRIRFSLSNGIECVVNEKGIAEVPSLRTVPAFNLEEELAGANEFWVEEASPAKAAKPHPRRFTRDELATLAGAAAGAAAPHEHED